MSFTDFRFSWALGGGGSEKPPLELDAEGGGGNEKEERLAGSAVEDDS